jgi:hypothetical protein
LAIFGSQPDQCVFYVCYPVGFIQQDAGQQLINGNGLLVGKHNHLVASSIAFGQNEQRFINLADFDTP